MPHPWTASATSSPKPIGTICCPSGKDVLGGWGHSAVSGTLRSRLWQGLRSEGGFPKSGSEYRRSNINLPGSTRAFLEGTTHAKARSLLHQSEVVVQGAAGGQEGENGRVSHFGKGFVILERDFSVTK